MIRKPAPSTWIKTFTRELKLDEEEAESIQKGNISSVPHVEKAVFEIIQEMADAVCDAVKRKPWKGYVAKVSAEYPDPFIREPIGPVRWARAEGLRTGAQDSGR